MSELNIHGEMFLGVGRIFYDIFRKLEGELVLDPLNETDIYCLHYGFVPRNNKCLCKFVESWNNHQLSSEHNLTPYQLFVTGSSEWPTDPVRDLSQVPIPAHIRVTDAVPVPCSSFRPCPILLSVLEQFITPRNFELSIDFGVDTYRQILSFVGTRVISCTICS